MDEKLLATKGIRPGEVNSGFVDDFSLRIGERATLVRRPGSRAYGLVMDIARDDAQNLYADESVADYAPETVVVELRGGAKVEATCYNLAVEKVTGANREYARSLLELATRIGFPDSYLEQIRQARE